MTLVLDGSANDGSDDGGSDSSVTFRIVIAANTMSAASGTQIQVSFRSGTASGSNSPAISGAWVGQGAGAGSINFTGNQVQLKFGGSNTFNITAVSQTITSDVVTLGEGFDNTKDYVVSVRIDGAAGNVHTTHAGAFTGTNSEFLLSSTAGEEALTTASGGYTAQANLLQFLRQIFITAAAAKGGTLPMMGVGRRQSIGWTPFVDPRQAIIRPTRRRQRLLLPDRMIIPVPRAA